MQVLKNLDNRSSSGVVSIGNSLVKITSDETVPYLTQDKTDEKKYRPISILPIWSKVFESIMFNRLYM